MRSSDFRAKFPALQSLHWFATPAAPPAAASVAAAMRRFALTWENGQFDWRLWEEQAETTRVLFARLIGAPPECVALVQSLADGASTIARAILPTLPSGRIVLAEQEFRSNLMAWTTFAATGHQIVLVPEERDRAWSDVLLDAVSEETVLVAISDVQSSTGARVALDALAARCRAVGARLFVNLTQSAGVLPINVDALGIDFAAAHGYKWLLAPRGAAWLYVRRDLIETVQALSPNWKNAVEPYQTMCGVPSAMAPDARRLDCSLAWPAWSPALAALALISGLPQSDVYLHCTSLAAALRTRLTELGIEVVRAGLPSHIVAARVPQADSLAKLLRERHVIAAPRDGLIRFGCHYFNSESDLEAAAAAMSAALTRSRQLIVT